MFFNAEELTNKKAKRIIKILFVGGFFCLPVLWMMLIWFLFNYISPTVNYRNKYIIICCVLLIIDFTILMIWNLVYQNNWFKWGATGDALSVNNYKGQL